MCQCTADSMLEYRHRSLLYRSLPVCSASSMARLLTSSPTVGLYQVASNPALRPALQSCLDLFCDALNAKSVVRYLSQVYEEPGAPISASEAEEDTPFISRETVTATGLTRAHRNMARSMTSEPAATVTTGATTTQGGDGSTDAAGNGSASTSTPTTSRSSSAAGPKATQNGGTVLDQAGTSEGASTILQAGSLWGMSMGVGCLVVGMAWLW